MHGPGSPRHPARLATLKDEAAWIAATIEDLRRRDGVRWSDLRRSRPQQLHAHDLSQHFQRLKVPHLPVENVKFFDARVKDAHGAPAPACSNRKRYPGILPLSSNGRPRASRSGPAALRGAPVTRPSTSATCWPLQPLNAAAHAPLARRLAKRRPLTVFRFETPASILPRRDLRDRRPGPAAPGSADAPRASTAISA